MFKMKMTAAVAAVALTAGGLAVAIATPAEAHTPSVSATCEALSVNLTNYAPSQPGQDAVDPVFRDWIEVVVDSPAQDAVPAVTHVEHHHDLVTPGKDAVSAVTHTEYEFKQFVTGHTKWNADRWWNPGLGWYFDGNTRVVVDTAAQDAVAAVYNDWDETVVDSPALDAIPAVTHDVPHHDLVTSGKDAVEAKANHVTVTIDGAVVADSEFSTSYSQSFAFSDKTTAHDYRVQVVGWDGYGNVDKSGTSTPCTPPKPVCGDDTDYQVTNSDAPCYVEPEQPRIEHREYTTEACVTPLDGTSTVTLWGVDTTIPQLFDPKTGTFSDGEKVEGDAYIVSTKTVKSEDCAAVVIPPTTPPAPPAAPVVAPAPVAPAAAPLAPVEFDQLAHTGSNTEQESYLLIAGAVLLLAAGLGALGVSAAIRRRRAFRQVMSRLSSIK